MRAVVVRDAHILLVLTLFANGLTGFLVPGPELLTETLYLALFFHIGLTIYAGDFTRTRKFTWPLLIVMSAVSQLAALFSWLRLSPVPFTTTAAVVMIVFALDLAAMQQARLRHMAPRRVPIWIAKIVLAAAVLGLALGAVIAVFATGLPETAPPGSEPDDLLLTPYRIVPEWYELPFYAVLRAIPDKLGGLLLMLAFSLVPAVWPWMRTERLRAGRMRWVWWVLCVALVLDWIGLGILGSRFPDETVIRATQALAACHFAFFLLPVLLWRRPGAGSAPAER